MELGLNINIAEIARYYVDHYSKSYKDSYFKNSMSLCSYYLTSEYIFGNVFRSDPLLHCAPDLYGHFVLLAGALFR